MTEPMVDDVSQNATPFTEQPPLGPIVVDVDTTLEERVALLRANGVRMQPGRQPGQWAKHALLPLLWVIVGVGVSLSDISPVISAMLIATLFIATTLWASRERILMVARSSTAAYRLEINADGLNLASAYGESRLAWSTVERIESREGATLLFLRNFQCLWVPDRSFASNVERETFIARLEMESAGQAQHIAPDQVPEHSRASFAHSVLGNLFAGLLLLGMRRNATRHLRVSVPQLVAVFALPILIGLGADLVRVGLDGRFNMWALAGAFYGLPWLLLAAWASAKLAGNERATLQASIAVQSMWCWMALIVQGLLFMPQEAWQAAGSAALILWWLPFAYAMLAAIPALIRTTGMAPEQRVGAVLIVVYILTLPLLATPRNQYLWVANQEEQEEASEEQRERWEAPTREAILYSQPRLLAETLDRVKPGTPGKPELFLLAVGGHGNQDVFMREVKSVTQLFAERFGTAGHSAALLNNPTTLNDYPLASVTALEETLRGIGERMNRDEDVLMLFMTSHGGDDFRFDLSMWPFKFDDLTPQRLKTALDKAGIRHRVVIVSSCYSGGFVPPLADPDTWVMTAARADRNSHGCSHEADWTFFGRAFFDEALRKTRSFEAAFDMAKTAIAEREKSEALTPSEPQTGGGEAVKPLLRAIAQASGS